MSENTTPQEAPATADAPDLPLFQSPGTPGSDPTAAAADDDFTNPPILRSIRPSFWDFCNKTNY